MLPKIYRLNKREIGKVFSKGKNYRGDFLIVKIIKNDLSFSRWSFIIPIETSKKVTQRNRLKRYLRESLRKKINLIKAGFDGVVLSLPSTSSKNYWEIDEEIDKIFRLANIYGERC